MSTETEPLPTPESIAAYVKQNTQRTKRAAPMMMDHAGGQEIVRQDDYKGHHIVVRTTYKIEADGRPVTGHVMLTNDGQVHYHGLPAMSFDSPIDLVKTLIDHFPQDFEGAGGSSGGHEGHGGSHHTSTGGHGGSAKPVRAAAKTTTKAKPKRRPAKRKSR